MKFINIFFLLFIASAQGKTREDYLNACLISNHHKTKPGPEAELYDQCTPWKKRSCCTNDTAAAIHKENLYSFNYDHCLAKKPLSAACKRHFVQDHCFYECSPNVGPWLQQEPHRSWRKERYYGVPLCATDCQTWFEDCKSDYTCTNNWSRNFDWIQLNVTDDVVLGDGKRCPKGAATCKVNVCPTGSVCVNFLEMFGNASNFCQKVWDGSWKYTSDKEPCMRMWFNGETHNPNDNVAAYFATKMASGVHLVNTPFLSAIIMGVFINLI